MNLVGSPALTTDVRLGAGRPVRTGSRSSFHPVAEIAGEPHLVRTELVRGGPTAHDVSALEGPLVCVAHITDLHVIDVQSPARFEFVNREWEDPRFRELLTMQRPHEAINTHAIDSMIQTINRLGEGPLTRAPLELLVMTGDSVDNTQRNELRNFLALMDGGAVRPDSGVLGYEGVQATTWPGDFYWKPDGAPEGDIFQSGFGFPYVPGLLEMAMQQFQVEGLKLPWLGCYGNHEEVCQGVGMVTAGLTQGMAGSRKAFALPEGIDADTAVELFIRSPEAFMTGPAFHVSADPERRPINRRDLVATYLAGGGHGFTEANLEHGTAYYVHDTPRVRFITLDTVCGAGGADGNVDAAQLAWLEDQLEAVHSAYTGRDGATVRTSNEDRLVVVLSHHGLDTLTNPRGVRGGDELLDILHRFQNVVLWLNGHIHANHITPRPDPRGGQGFWEVTTSSIVDWPCQARLVEMFNLPGGNLAIGCTMLDHSGGELAGLHRELAANVPFRGFDTWHQGDVEDRNVILLLRRPF
ncbi:MAG: metallophosphoesterase [Candidatus Dormibacterales bacterium]